MADNAFSTNIISGATAQSLASAPSTTPVPPGEISKELLEFSANLINTANSSVQTMASAGQWSLNVITIIIGILSLILALIAIYGYREIRRKVQHWVNITIDKHKKKADDAITEIRDNAEQAVRNYLSSEEFSKKISDETQRSIQNNLYILMQMQNVVKPSSNEDAPIAPQLPHGKGV